MVLDVLLTVLALGLGGVALWWALRLEPHWSSRDGRRMTARVQAITVHGQVQGRWREVRGVVIDDEHLSTRARGLPNPQITGSWRIVTASLDEPGRKAVYVLQRVDGSTASTEQLVLRIPASSRARPVLDALAATPPTASGD